MRHDLLWDSTDAGGPSTLCRSGPDPRANLVHAGGAPTESSSSLVRLSVHFRRHGPQTIKGPARETQ